MNRPGGGMFRAWSRSQYQVQAAATDNLERGDHRVEGLGIPWHSPAALILGIPWQREEDFLKTCAWVQIIEFDTPPTRSAAAEQSLLN